METKIASTKDILPGKMVGLQAQGKSILVANVNGTFYAIGNICMHMGCTLSDGTLKGEKVICPCHGSTYDVRTGAFLKGPTTQPEPSYPLKIAGDQILLVG